MATPHPRRTRATLLRGRRAELRVLDDLVAAVRAGESRASWCAASRAWARRRCWSTWPSRRRGAGWCARPACSRRWSWRSPGCISCARRCWIASSGCRCRSVTRCGPRSALSAGPAPDRFLVGLAVLSLLSEVAGEQPLLCLVDDEQWLDRASAQVLGFVARRLAAESVGLVFATRVPGEELAGLPELAVEGLTEGDARALLDSVLTGPLDARVRDQIVAETRGNPLALLELPRGLTPAELAGGFGLPGAVPLLGPDRGELPAAARRAARPRPGGCCCSRRPSRSATRCWCGGRPGGSGSVSRRRRRRPRPAWSSSAPGCGSGIRWCARRPTGRRRCRSGRRCTAPWPRRPTRQLIPTAGPGTGPRPRPGPTRTSPPSWSARPAGRRRAAGWPRRPRSWSGRRC